jgi:hypothetical protein
VGGLKKEENMFKNSMDKKFLFMGIFIVFFVFLILFSHVFLETVYAYCSLDAVYCCELACKLYYAETSSDCLTGNYCGYYLDEGCFYCYCCDGTTVIGSEAEGKSCADYCYYNEGIEPCDDNGGGGGGGNGGCIPATSCPCGDYATSSQGYGSIIVTCDDGCGDTASSTCYCPAADVDCADYDDGTGISWFNDSPVDEKYREAELEIPIANPLDGCPDSQTKTCYVPYSENTPPTNTSIEIIPAGNVNSVLSYSTSNIFSKLINQIKAAEFLDDKILGYSSEDHSGRGLVIQEGGGINNPIGIKATYSDPNGQEDIQALYIWWNPSTAKNFPTPNQILTGQPQINSNQNFGFLISRNGIGGAWDSVYIPRISGTDKIWIRKGGINDQIEIAGPSPADMVVVDDIGISQSDNEVHLQLTMRFKTDTDDTVTTSLYNLWGMANDYIGFTEFEENGMIKDSEDEYWEKSGETWTLDMVQPVITEGALNAEDTDKSQVTISIDVNDDDNLSYIRLDACKTGIDAPTPLGSEYIVDYSYNLQTCDSFSEEKENIDVTSPDSLLGTEGKRYDYNQSNYSTGVDIYLGNNKEGAITFHLTVLDKAGNVKQDMVIYKLEQWATAKDGFVFGRNGVTSSTRGVDVNQWDDHPVLEGFRDSYVNDVDLTNQVLLGAKSLNSIFLRELIRTDSNNSFSAANYPGIFLGLPYQELKMAYTNKAGKENIDLVRIENDTLRDWLPTDCETEYCILEREGNLSIDNFKCNGKALIAVNGNVTIQPHLTNDTNQDACIILASGDISIGDGDRVTTGNVPGYDIVEAFLIAGGKIDIPKEDDFDPPNDDGLYVEGGLVSFTPPSGLENRSSVYNQREIHFSNMGVYPVLVVDNNAKYGLLSKTVFGSQIDIFKIEIGFKPY